MSFEEFWEQEYGEHCGLTVMSKCRMNISYDAGVESQQAIIDELKHQKSLQELEINQISQSNQEWQRVNSELQKRVDNALSRIDESKALVDDPYDIVSDVEKALRGKHE